MKRTHSLVFLLSVAVFAVVGMLVADCMAKPKSVLGKTIGGWSKRGKVLELRRRHSDQRAEVIIFTPDEKVAMYLLPKKMSQKLEKMKCLHTFDLEKVKVLKADAGWAHKQVMDYPDLQGKLPIIRAITLEEEDGKLFYWVHCYHPTGGYLRAWVVDTTTWKVIGDRTGQTDPCLPEVKWGEPIGEEEEAGEGETTDEGDQDTGDEETGDSEDAG